MKNNKHGWGVSEMIALLGILLFFFLLVIVLTVNFYKSVTGDDVNVDTKSYTSSESDDSVINVSSYEEFEAAMENAANDYIMNKYGTDSNIDSVIIDGVTLLNLGYYSNVGFEDCNGYVDSSVIDDVITSNAFIKCNSYTTEGYGD